jgi:tetratricopeptide (TPR) repeat protein
VPRKVSRWLRVRYAILTAGIAVVIAGRAMGWFAESSSARCEREVQDKNWKQVIEICSSSHEQTGDQRELLWVAKAHASLGRYEDADRLARRLLGGSEWGDAHILLSHLARRYGDHAEARLHATVALGAHTIARDRAGLVGALHQLSQAALAAGDPRAALATAEMAVGLARQLDDRDRERVVSLGLADVLRRLGDDQVPAPR